MKMSRKIQWRLGMFVTLGASVLNVIAEPVDCADPPNGIFPLAPVGAHTDCNEHWGVHYDTDSVTGERTNYTWGSSGSTGTSSVCWNGLYTYYGATNSWPDDPYRPIAPPPAGGAPAPGGSADCGWSVDLVSLQIQPPYGFRAPISPLATPGLGDFLPPSPTLSASSVSLVPSGMGSESTWWNDATRQTLHQSVDLVTGLPLARVSQLELPFDGATFRLIRTRSGQRRDQMGFGPADGNLDFDRLAATDRWWDWSGQGWMANENPLLIVDSSVPDLVGNNPKTTWLVLDAHHSIPFQQIESNGIYAAPPRFRAKLSHNGTWDETNRNWAENGAPTQMEVFLYDGALKYTFVIVREDIPPHVWDQSPSGAGDGDATGSLHDRPFVNEQFPGDRYNSWDPLNTCVNPGLGLPYYGLLVQIEDRSNHKVEINYHGVKQKSVDYFNEATDGESNSDTDGTSCVECGQSCAKKGLIQSVKLKSGDDVRWSLIYAYRGFRNTVTLPAGQDVFDNDGVIGQVPSEEELRFREQDLWGEYHIDRIYAFKVDAINLDPEADIIAESGENYFLGLNHSELLDLDGVGPAFDPLTELLGTGVDSKANLWTHLVQNHFVQKLDWQTNEDAGVWNNATKVMTAVTSRVYPDVAHNEPPIETIKHWVYQYTIDGQETPLTSPIVQGASLRWDLNWLSSIYTPDDVASVITSDELGFTNKVTLENLAYMTHPDTDAPLLDEPDELGAMAKYASYRFGNGRHYNNTWPSAAGTQDAPDPTSLVENYLLNEADTLMTDMQFQVVGKAAIPDETGKVRYYQINRLRVMPTWVWIDHPNDEPFVPSWFAVGEEMNMRSAFVHPYQWHGYAPIWNDGWPAPSTAQSPDLTAVRWITVVDEYADERDLFPSNIDLGMGYGTYNGENATKKTQMSRRVVELSPSGYLLRDRKWEFTDDGVMRSGGGLGEQFIYSTIENYFNDFADVDKRMPPSPDQGTATRGRTRNTDALSSIRNELLKVEYRSIGWSAGELIQMDADHSDHEDDYASHNGYTEFTEYDVFHPSGETWSTYIESPTATRDSEKLIPLISRVQPVAAGFHRGSNYAPDPNSAGRIPSGNVNEQLYTSQVIRDADVPTDIIASFDFISKTTESDLLDELPPADWQNPDMSYQIQRTYIERDDTELGDDDLVLPEEEQRVTSRMVVGIPKKMYPGSSWYYPVEREFYDEEGNPIWACTGLLMDPSDPNQASEADPYESLTFTYYQRDDEGRSLNTVLDAVPNSIADFVGISPAMSSHTDHLTEEIMEDDVFWPQDKSGIYWIRVSDSSVPGGNLPLNYVTSFEYDRYAPGLCDIYYPSGRRWARRVITIIDPDTENSFMDEYAREFIYNNLELRSTGGSGAVWTTTSEGEVKDYRSTNTFQQPVISRNVTFVAGTLPNDSGTLHVSRSTQPTWILNSTIEMGVDSNGRIQKASLLERSPSGALLAVGSKEINDLGELYREQEFDETVTVQTRNSIGQTMRVYQGTEDRRWYLPPSAWTGIPTPNMILLERTEYGNGVNDAWLPTVSRQYLKTPSWAKNDLFGDVPNVTDINGVYIGDVDGQATIVGYDWQSRAVRTDTYARGDPFADGGIPRRLSTSLVYLDYLDRPYLEVTYGEDPVDGGMLTLPASLDPTAYVDAAAFPATTGGELDIAQLYFDDIGLRPVSLTQNFYSIDGTLIERRSYDSGWDAQVDSSPTYLANYSYNGRGGNQIFSQSPGGAVGVTYLDSVGRVSATAMMVPTTLMYADGNEPVDLVERERTDLVYDADGNVVETKHWERVTDYTDAIGEQKKLDLTNAIRTRTLNWYDVQKRLVATASLGTEDASGRYLASDEVYSHLFPGPGDDFTAVEFKAPYWDESTSSVMFEGNTSSLADALVRVYVYDETGNKILSVDPKGIATRFEYTATGRLAYKIENAADPIWENQRMTGYRYQAGRLVEMNLVTFDGRGNDPVQTGDLPSYITGDVVDADADVAIGLVFAHRTRLEYGADIVSYYASSGGYGLSSRSNKLIGAMHLPNEQTGDPADDADVILRYTYAGQIAQRFNSAGEAFKYLYDEQGRLTDVIVGVWDPTETPVFVDIDPVAGSPFTTPEPTDKIRYIHYTYDVRGNLTDVEAWTEQDPVDRILIAHTRMAYDTRDRLVKEWQLHGDGIIDELKTPHMAYSWEYESTDLGLAASDASTGHDRLASMTYPVPNVNTNPRVLTMEYGESGTQTDPNDLMSRLTAVKSNIGTYALADFEYSGSGRRISMGLKNGNISSSSDYSTDPNIPELNGLDMFGRKVESRYVGNNGADILYQANYTFDKSGNRTSALITQADVGGQSRYNIRSVVNVYDDLQRLIGAQVGQLVGTLDAPQINPTSVVHNDSWSLDRLGNWTGKIDDQTGELLEHGRRTTGTLDSFGVPWSISTYDSYTSYDFGITQAVTQRDSITQLGIFDQTDGGVASEEVVKPWYDEAGRTLFDGEYGYHYDAWGRVVQINEASVVYNDLTGLQVGFAYDRMLKHFVYDGFGRLVRSSSPVDDPDAQESAEIVQSISFFYDGARRVQEIINDPVSTIAGALNSGDSGLEGLADESTNLSNPDGSNAPLSLEKGQNPEPYTRNIYREYVWGPGDNGPDELLLQTDEFDEEYWCLMDGGGDLVALATVDVSSNIQVVRQWTYDAYGAILTAEHLGASLETHVGHKGLFVDRLDVAMSVDSPESPRLVPFGHTLYQNRNRSYSPSLGRFLQMDPNQTAMALLSNTASHGRGLGAIAIAFSMEGMYGDGLNLYQYLGSNPWTSSDPLGLSGGRVDPWDQMDEIVNEYIGARAAILSSFGSDMAAAAIIAAQIASYLPFPGVGLAGDLALVALGEMSMDDAILGAAIGIIPGGKLLKLLNKTGAGKAMGALGSSAWKQAKRLASNGGGFLRNAAGGIVNKAKRLLNRKAKKAGSCGCFTAATLVLTANGAVPIVDIEAGHQVLSAVDDGLSQDYSANKVGTKIIIGEASLVQLVVSHEDGSTETINTTDEHPFHVAETAEWTRADQLLIGDELSTISGVAVLQGVTYTTARVPVYNLSIPGSPTYYVGEHGVWVHNCFFDEVFDKLDDAIGFTGINGVKIVDDVATKSQILIDEGFSRTYYALDEFGEQWTVFFNPKKGKFGGAHLSSSNP